MKVAVVGSRTLKISNLSDYLPAGTTEIVSGGAVGIDMCARNYAIKNNITLKEFLPQYDLYGKTAPLIRNRLIVDYADEVVAFWDNRSRGTIFTINYARERGKSVCVIRL